MQPAAAAGELTALRAGIGQVLLDRGALAGARQRAKLSLRLRGIADHELPGSRDELLNEPLEYQRSTNIRLRAQQS